MAALARPTAGSDVTSGTRLHQRSRESPPPATWRQSAALSSSARQLASMGQSISRSSVSISGVASCSREKCGVSSRISFLEKPRRTLFFGGPVRAWKRGQVSKLCFKQHSTCSARHVSFSALSIEEKFRELKAKNEIALIPFIVAGDPDLATTEKALHALTANGADVIELGVPYSDPLADGPVIQAASARALSKGTDLQSVLNLLKKVSPSLSAPVVLFTYFNPIMKRGLQQFMTDAKAAGAAGLVVPDVPLEETGPLREEASRAGLELVLLTTPTTPTQRMHAIADATQGFLYLVSLTGVTGERTAVEGRVQDLLKDIKKASDKPVAVGFGISKPEHVEQVVSWGADGVIVGSALVRLLSEASDPNEGVEEMGKLMKSLKAICLSTAVVS